MSESTDSPEFPGNEPPAGLPAVQPPTAGLIVQLFGIPLAIVIVAVMVWLLFGKIAASHRTPEDYLADLRRSNFERRWSAARDLASILPRNKEWQNNESFARELAKELEAELSKGETAPAELRYLQYLAEVLGEFNSAAGIPALRQALGPDVRSEVRVKAILGLGRLADRMGGLSDPDAISDLVGTLKDDDPAIRSLAAWVIGRTGSSRAVSGLTAALNDADQEVRHNAAASLARLGSTASLATLQEMLDLDRLRQSLRERGLTDPQVETQLEAIPWSAIQSLSVLLDKSPDTDLESLRSLVASVAKVGTRLVQTRAKELLIKMDARKPQN